MQQGAGDREAEGIIILMESSEKYIILDKDL